MGLLFAHFYFYLFFLKILFLSNLYTQHGAETHPEIKGHMLCLPMALPKEIFLSSLLLVSAHLFLLYSLSEWKVFIVLLSF